MPIHATTAEINEAWTQLTKQDLLQLRKAAAHFIREARRSPYSEPLDLIHEAFVRALDGRRNWPLHITFRNFMVETMRSVINHDTDNLDNKPGAHVAWESLEVEGIELAFDATSPSAEDVAIAFEGRALRVKALKAADEALAREGDSLARNVLRGWAEELTKKQTQRRFGIDAKSYDAARKRAQRRLWTALSQTGALH